MKKFFKVWVALLLLGSIGFMAACDGNKAPDTQPNPNENTDESIDYENISAPIVTQTEAGLYYWMPIKEAEGYVISVDGNVIGIGNPLVLLEDENDLPEEFIKHGQKENEPAEDKPDPNADKANPDEDKEPTDKVEEPKEEPKYICKFYLDELELPEGEHQIRFAAYKGEKLSNWSKTYYITRNTEILEAPVVNVVEGTFVIKSSYNSFLFDFGDNIFATYTEKNEGPALRTLVLRPEDLTFLPKVVELPDKDNPGEVKEETIVPSLSLNHSYDVRVKAFNYKVKSAYSSTVKFTYLDKIILPTPEIKGSHEVDLALGRITDVVLLGEDYPSYINATINDTQINGVNISHITGSNDLTVDNLIYYILETIDSVKRQKIVNQIINLGRLEISIQNVDNVLYEVSSWSNKVSYKFVNVDKFLNNSLEFNQYGYYLEIDARIPKTYLQYNVTVNGKEATSFTEIDHKVVYDLVKALDFTNPLNDIRANVTAKLFNQTITVTSPLFTLKITDLKTLMSPVIVDMLSITPKAIYVNPFFDHNKMLSFEISTENGLINPYRDNNYLVYDLAKTEEENYLISDLSFKAIISYKDEKIGEITDFTEILEEILKVSPVIEGTHELDVLTGETEDTISFGEDIPELINVRINGFEFENVAINALENQNELTVNSLIEALINSDYNEDLFEALATTSADGIFTLAIASLYSEISKSYYSEEISYSFTNVDLLFEDSFNINLNGIKLEITNLLPEDTTEYRVEMNGNVVAEYEEAQENLRIYDLFLAQNPEAQYSFVNVSVKTTLFGIEFEYTHEPILVNTYSIKDVANRLLLEMIDIEGFKLYIDETLDQDDMLDITLKLNDSIVEPYIENNQLTYDLYETGKIIDGENKLTVEAAINYNNEIIDTIVLDDVFEITDENDMIEETTKINLSFDNQMVEVILPANNNQYLTYDSIVLELNGEEYTLEQAKYSKSKYILDLNYAEHLLVGTNDFNFTIKYTLLGIPYEAKANKGMLISEEDVEDFLRGLYEVDYNWANLNITPSFEDEYAAKLTVIRKNEEESLTLEPNEYNNYALNYGFGSNKVTADISYTCFGEDRTLNLLTAEVFVSPTVSNVLLDNSTISFKYLSTDYLMYLAFMIEVVDTDEKVIQSKEIYPNFFTGAGQINLDEFTNLPEEFTVNIYPLINKDKVKSPTPYEFELHKQTKLPYLNYVDSFIEISPYNSYNGSHSIAVPFRYEIYGDGELVDSNSSKETVKFDPSAYKQLRIKTQAAGNNVNYIDSEIRSYDIQLIEDVEYNIINGSKLVMADYNYDSNIKLIINDTIETRLTNSEFYDSTSYQLDLLDLVEKKNVTSLVLCENKYSFSAGSLNIITRPATVDLTTRITTIPELDISSNKVKITSDDTISSYEYRIIKYNQKSYDVSETHPYSRDGIDLKELKAGDYYIIVRQCGNAHKLSGEWSRIKYVSFNDVNITSKLVQKYTEVAEVDEKEPVVTPEIMSSALEVMPIKVDDIMNLFKFKVTINSTVQTEIKVFDQLELQKFIYNLAYNYNSTSTEYKLTITLDDNYEIHHSKYPSITINLDRYLYKYEDTTLNKQVFLLKGDKETVLPLHRTEIYNNTICYTLKEVWGDTVTYESKAYSYTNLSDISKNRYCIYLSSNTKFNIHDLKALKLDSFIGEVDSYINEIVVTPDTEVRKTLVDFLNPLPDLYNYYITADDKDVVVLADTVKATDDIYVKIEPATINLELEQVLVDKTTNAKATNVILTLPDRSDSISKNYHFEITLMAGRKEAINTLTRIDVKDHPEIYKYKLVINDYAEQYQIKVAVKVNDGYTNAIYADSYDTINTLTENLKRVKYDYYNNDLDVDVYYISDTAMPTIAPKKIEIVNGVICYQEEVMNTVNSWIYRSVYKTEKSDIVEKSYYLVSIQSLTTKFDMADLTLKDETKYVGDLEASIKGVILKHNTNIKSEFTDLFIELPEAFKYYAVASNKLLDDNLTATKEEVIWIDLINIQMKIKQNLDSTNAYAQNTSIVLERNDGNILDNFSCELVFIDENEANHYVGCNYNPDILNQCKLNLFDLPHLNEYKFSIHLFVNEKKSNSIYENKYNDIVIREYNMNRINYNYNDDSLDTDVFYEKGTQAPTVRPLQKEIYNGNLCALQKTVNLEADTTYESIDAVKAATNEAYSVVTLAVNGDYDLKNIDTSNYFGRTNQTISKLILKNDSFIKNELDQVIGSLPVGYTLNVVDSNSAEAFPGNLIELSPTVKLTSDIAIYITGNKAPEVIE